MICNKMRHALLVISSEAKHQVSRKYYLFTMEQLKYITEFVVVSNLENRALNAGIDKAQNWWRNRHNNSPPDNRINPIRQPQVATPRMRAIPGQLLVTVLRGQDLHEPRLSMLTGSTSFSEHPYVVIECNQQRFQTTQADSNSSNRNPRWSSNNGPFEFDVFNAYADRLTIWIQQDSVHMIKRNERKTLGMGEINISQLIGQRQIWLPLRKDNKPAGQILLQITFFSNNDSPPPYN